MEELITAATIELSPYRHGYFVDAGWCADAPKALFELHVGHYRMGTGYVEDLVNGMPLLNLRSLGFKVQLTSVDKIPHQVGLKGTSDPEYYCTGVDAEKTRAWLDEKFPGAFPDHLNHVFGGVPKPGSA